MRSSSRALWAVLVGKFMPPHVGHEYLIRFAMAYAERVTIFVGNPFGQEVFPAQLRATWLREHFGDQIDVLVPPEGDLSSVGRLRAARMGLQYFREIFGDTKPDVVIGADAYTRLFASLVGAKAVISDTIVIRATAIRENPLAHWDMILPPARSFFLNEVLVVGNGKDLNQAAAITRAASLLCVRLDKAPLERLGPMLTSARQVARRAALFCVLKSQLASFKSDFDGSRAGIRRMIFLPSSQIHGASKHARDLASQWGATAEAASLDQLQGILCEVAPGQIRISPH